MPLVCSARRLSSPRGHEEADVASRMRPGRIASRSLLKPPRDMVRRVVHGGLGKAWGLFGRSSSSKLRCGLWRLPRRGSHAETPPRMGRDGNFDVPSRYHGQQRSSPSLALYPNETTAHESRTQLLISVCANYAWAHAAEWPPSKLTAPEMRDEGRETRDER